MEDEFPLKWWGAAIAAGVLGNIAFVCVRPYLDRLLSGLSSAWRLRSDARKARHTALLDHLSSSEHEQVMFVMGTVQFRQRATTHLAWAVLLMVGVLWGMAEYDGLRPLSTFEMNAGLVLFAVETFAAFGNIQAAIARDRSLRVARVLGARGRQSGEARGASGT